MVTAVRESYLERVHKLVVDSVYVLQGGPTLAAPATVGVCEGESSGLNCFWLGFNVAAQHKRLNIFLTSYKKKKKLI